MCDEHTVKDNQAFLANTLLTRRQFNSGLSLAMLATMLPGPAQAAVTASEVLITTPDGEADAYLVHPAEGRHPAVIMWPDIMGIRPAFRLMGERLAQSGYTVLVVNPYYRSHRGDIIAAGESVQDAEVRTRLMPHYHSLNATTCVTDGRAFVDYLDSLASVDSARRMGVCGYCMTGSYALRLAAALPQRIGAGASFHGGGLVSDAPDSPHLLLPQIDAGLLVAIAENDDARDPEAKVVLGKAAAAAGVAAEIEVYEGTLHGWCPLDSRVYHEQQAERAWGRLLALLGRNLGDGGLTRE